MDKRLLNYALVGLTVCVTLYLFICVIKEIIYLVDYSNLNEIQKIIVRGGRFSLPSN